MFAALQSTVVRLHVASLTSFIRARYFQAAILHIFSSFMSGLSQLCSCLVCHIPPRPITMLCHVRPGKNIRPEKNTRPEKNIRSEKNIRPEKIIGKLLLWCLKKPKRQLTYLLSYIYWAYWVLTLVHQRSRRHQMPGFRYLVNLQCW